MKQFDVFEEKGGGLFAVLQSNLLGALETVMVAPLVDINAAPMTRLTPTMQIGNDRYRLDIPQQVPARTMSLRNQTPVASVGQHRDEILDAVNLLYWGI